MTELVSSSPGASGSLIARVQEGMRNWRTLSRDNKSILTIALLAAIVAGTIVVILWTSSKNYVPLYGKQELYDTANIMEMLEKEQVALPAGEKLGPDPGAGEPARPRAYGAGGARGQGGHAGWPRGAGHSDRSWHQRVHGRGSLPPCPGRGAGQNHHLRWMRCAVPGCIWPSPSEPCLSAVTKRNPAPP